MKLSRWNLAISTSASVMLFTIAALMTLKNQNYVMAAVFFSFAFLNPLLDEAMREKLLKSEAELESDAAITPKPGTGVGCEDRLS